MSESFLGNFRPCWRNICCKFDIEPHFFSQVTNWRYLWPNEGQTCTRDVSWLNFSFLEEKRTSPTDGNVQTFQPVFVFEKVWMLTKSKKIGKVYLAQLPKHDYKLINHFLFPFATFKLVIFFIIFQIKIVAFL